MRLILLAITCVFSANASAALNLYTDRPTAVVEKMTAAFKAKTGIEVKITELPYPTLKGTLQTEGAASPADIIYVNDLVFLSELTRDGRFQPMPSAVAKKVDSAMRDPQNNWAAITFRARTLVYLKGLDVSSINTYEDLANSELQGTFCTRGNNSYVVSLISSLVLNYGYDKTQTIVNGYVANRTEDMFYPNDTSVVTAIATGALAADGSTPACLLGLVNSYYVGKYLQKEPNAPVELKFLKMPKGGVHVNGTGAGIAKTSKQKEEAAKFLEFLLSKDNQLFLTNEHQDFPAAIGVTPNNVSSKWWPIDFDKSNWAAIGDNDAEANLIMIDAKIK